MKNKWFLGITALLITGLLLVGCINEGNSTLSKLNQNNQGEDNDDQGKEKQNPVDGDDPTYPEDPVL